MTQALRELVRYRVMRGTETVAGRSLGSSCVQGWFSGALLLVLAGIGYALTTLVAFVVSATNGLFGWQEVWSGTPQAVVGFTELAAVLLLLPALARAAVRSPSRNRGVVRQ